MREVTVSNCEKAFLLKAILQGKRIDGRKGNDARKLDIVFGKSWGCCLVSLGETRVMAQTTYEVQNPKTTKPTEGILIINVELSPMAAKHIEPGRPSDASIQISRLLDKCFKESRCLDLESLCIVAEEKVWAVRVDVTVLNHDGSVVDCASIAALASLAHSRRPDVTLSGEEVTIHPVAERDPLPLTLHHNPICVSYAIFKKGIKVVGDPSAAEEEAAETNLVVGMNAYKELCGLHLDGSGLPSHDENDVILQCVHRAGARAIEVVNYLKQTLAADESRRQQKENVGFSEFVRLEKMCALSEDRIPIRLHKDDLQSAVNKIMNNQNKNKRKVWDEDGNEREVLLVSDEEEVVDLGDHTAELVNQKSKLPRRIHLNLGKMEESSQSDEDSEEDDESEEEENSEDDSPRAAITKKEEKVKPDSDSDSVMEISSAEEEVQTKPKIEGDNKKLKNKNDSKGNTKRKDKGKKVFKAEDPVSDNSDEIEVVQELTYEDKMRLAEKIILDDSEEEETVVLPGNSSENPPAKEQSQAQPATPEKGKEKAETSNQKKQKKKNRNKKARTWYPQGNW